MTAPQVILVTPGEPAGIGPDVTLMATQQDWPASIVAIADPGMLADRATLLGLDIKIKEWNVCNETVPHTKGTLHVLPEPVLEPVVPGKPNIKNAEYVIRTLQTASTLCVKHVGDALVTGPVNKGLLQEAGFTFTGHTEFLAQCAGVSHTVMLFVLDELKVALATTHLPISSVPKHITQDSLEDTIEILNNALQDHFHIEAPRILVCGLNPHAGENGHLGMEEIEVIEPALVVMREAGVLLEGPLPADTIFTPKYLNNADAILSMYHDQALPLVKYRGFDRAVNVTLGLPYIRTSVDHGTALDIAGSGKANDGSMKAALSLGLKLSELA